MAARDEAEAAKRWAVCESPSAGGRSIQKAFSSQRAFGAEDFALGATASVFRNGLLGHENASDVATAIALAEDKIETAGVNYVLTRFAFGNLSFEDELRSATLFAREVMPRFAREPGLV